MYLRHELNIDDKATAALHHLFVSGSSLRGSFPSPTFNHTDKLLQLLMNLLIYLPWLARAVAVYRNIGIYNGPPRTARRQSPPDTRIDLSGERNPLTRPPSPRLEAEFTTDSPQACLLLDVLPLEVRQLIWEEVLGGHYFHLDLRSNVLIGEFCVSKSPNTCLYSSGGCRLRLPEKIIQLEKNLLLPILLSCKQT